MIGPPTSSPGAEGKRELYVTPYEARAMWHLTPVVLVASIVLPLILIPTARLLGRRSEATSSLPDAPSAS